MFGFWLSLLKRQPCERPKEAISFVWPMQPIRGCYSLLTGGLNIMNGGGVQVPAGGADGFYDSRMDAIQDEKDRNIEQQKVEIQQQELQIQQQQQDTNQLLVIGGLSLIGIIVLATVAILTIKALKKRK